MEPYDPFARIDPRFFRNDTPGVIASPNERAILRMAWREPGLPRAALPAALDLTQQSVHRLVDQLVSRGLLRVGPPRKGGGRGQPSPTLTLDPAWGLSAGITVNTDQAGLSVMGLDGNHMIRSVDIAGLGRAAGLDRIEAALDGLLAERGVTRRDLFGLGFGIAGYLVGGTTFNAPEPLRDWSLVELGPVLSDRFDLPVWTDNAANTAAIAESTLGTGLTVSDFAYLSFNYGFGGAIISEGRLLRGARGNAGEFSGIFRAETHFRRPALKPLIDTLGRHGVHLATISELRTGFRADWPGVAEWVEEVTPHFQQLINAISAVVDPEAIVLGGEIPGALARLLIERGEFWGTPRYGVARANPRLVLSSVRHEASAIGAAAMPISACLI